MVLSSLVLQLPQSQELVNNPPPVSLTGYPEPIRSHKLFRVITLGEKIMSEQKATCQTRKAYKTDLTDAQWALVEGLIPPAVPKPGCEPTNVREILNTILYQNRTGCQWDMLPHDLSAKEYGLRLLQGLARQWCLGTSPRRTAW